MTHSVYLITNNFNTMKYVGVSTDPLNRFEQHISANSTLGRAIQHHGVEHFSMTVLIHNLSEQEAYTKEIEFIKSLNTLYPNGYNIDKGGKGGGKKNNPLIFEPQEDDLPTKFYLSKYVFYEKELNSKAFNPKVDYHKYYDDILKDYEYESIPLTDFDQIEFEYGYEFIKVHREVKNSGVINSFIFYDPIARVLIFQKYLKSSLLFKEIPPSILKLINEFSYVRYIDSNLTELKYGGSSFWYGEYDYNKPSYKSFLEKDKIFMRIDGDWKELLVLPDDIQVNKKFLVEGISYNQQFKKSQKEQNRTQESYQIMQNGCGSVIIIFFILLIFIWAISFN